MHASRRREYKVETAYIAVRLNGNGLPNYLSSAVAVNVQPAEINAFTVMDSTAQTAGAAFNALITATDTYGNAITGNRCLTFSGPANGPDGTRPSYPAQGSCAAGQSEVAFTGAPTLVPVTLYRAAATRLTVTDVTSPLSHTTASFTVKPAVANKLSVTQSPGNTVAGVVFATQPQVTVQDHYGNTVTTDTSNVTITVTGGTATLTGCAANPRAATGGVATFSGCKIATAGTYTLTATDGSLTPAVSVSFTISANISQGKSVVCSSLETGGAFPCASAVDGDAGTRWSSDFSDPQWIYVDLGATHTISQVVLNWETAYGKSFQIQTSSDATNWTMIYSTTTGTVGTQTLAVTGTGRYVRMYGTVRATQWGYSLWEFQVFGS